MSTAEEPATETREDIPLKRGKKSSNWYSCNEDTFSGFKFIIIAFSTLTCVITIALLLQIYYGDYQIVPHGSVSTDSLECSKIGTSILKQGGKAIDAAIASTFCLAVAAPHLTGLEAEGQIMVYNHKSRLPPNVIDFSGPLIGPKKIPRLVMGLAYAHQQFGNLPWKELVEPAADLAHRGYLISKVLVEAVTKSKAEESIGRLEAGQILTQENLSNTLYNIANIPEEELQSYIQALQPTLSQALKFSFNNYDIYVPKTPMGSALMKNLGEIEKLNFTSDDSIKPGYIYQLLQVTQNTYVEENISKTFHEGTSSNVAVIDLDDNYVSLITGMSKLFGTGEMTEHGYVLDEPNKEKPSSRIPFIITDGNFICGRRMVLGANNLAGATQLIATLLIDGKNATEGIESARFYIFDNGTVGVEDSHLPSFNEDVLNYLESVMPNMTKLREPYPSSNIVEKTRDDLSSHSDSRGGGIASRF